MSRPVFGDPRTDFIFQRVFGSEDHKPVLVGFLNDVLGLEGAHRVEEVSFLPPEQRPKVSELKYSIVDVKCVDGRGVGHVVELQVLNVEAFEKRVVYNVAKAYTNQLDVGDDYPEPNDVIGISICDFMLWPPGEGAAVPMLSQWRMQEQSSGVRGLPEMQFVFLELPKYDATREPRTLVEKWAYFFREARNLTVIPPSLAHPPLVQALEAARTAHFTKEEWDAYIAAGMAIQNERGALAMARREPLRLGIETTCRVLDIEITPERRARLDSLRADELEALLVRLGEDRRWPVDG